MHKQSHSMAIAPLFTEFKAALKAANKWWVHWWRHSVINKQQLFVLFFFFLGYNWLKLHASFKQNSLVLYQRWRENFLQTEQLFSDLLNLLPAEYKLETYCVIVYNKQTIFKKKNRVEIFWMSIRKKKSNSWSNKLFQDWIILPVLFSSYIYTYIYTNIHVYVYTHTETHTNTHTYRQSIGRY